MTSSVVVDELALVELGVGTDPVQLVDGQHRGEPLTHPIGEVEPQLIRQRAKSVVVGRVGDEPADRVELLVVELSPGLDAPHDRSG